jgi:hypothetical protein
LGVGVGFEPITGILNGFVQPVEIEIIRSKRTNRGDDNNTEKHYKKDGKRIWHLIVGDSGIAWAKAAGKLVAMKKPVDIIIIDFSEVRPGGKPLRGFGWISSGDQLISEAFRAIAEILNKKSGELLSKIDILDIMNWLGTALSSRRSAEIAIMSADDPEAEEFAVAKKDCWSNGNTQRSQSNNSLVFYYKPTKRELRGLFSQMLAAGGSEPGFINGVAARKRAPWFRGVNPCCLPGDTQIYYFNDVGEVTRDYIYNIVSMHKNMVGGINIPSYNIHSGEIERDVIDAADITEVGANIIEIELESGELLKLTPDHKVYTENRGWVEAVDLTNADILIVM